MHHQLEEPQDLEECATFWTRLGCIAAGAYYGFFCANLAVAYQPNATNGFFTKPEILFYSAMAGAMMGLVVHENRHHIANGLRGIKNLTSDCVSGTVRPILQVFYNNTPSREVDNTSSNAPQLTV